MKGSPFLARNIPQDSVRVPPPGGCRRRQRRHGGRRGGGLQQGVDLLPDGGGGGGGRGRGGGHRHRVGLVLGAPPGRQDQVGEPLLVLHHFPHTQKKVPHFFLAPGRLGDWSSLPVLWLCLSSVDWTVYRYKQKREKFWPFPGRCESLSSTLYRLRTAGMLVECGQTNKFNVSAALSLSFCLCGHAVHNMCKR